MGSGVERVNAPAMAPESKPLTGTASSLLEQSKGLGDRLYRFNNILDRAGLKSMEPPIDKAETPLPDNLQWILRDAESAMIAHNAELENLLDLLERELT